jgi:glycosyltransferase involved in cell wall biosynthesis/SAM-dependent methyltransferase
LKLIFYSTAPHSGVGYGVLTKHLVKRMIADGHQVKVATKHPIGGILIEDGIEVFDGLEIGLVNKIAEEEKYDFIITAMDVWPLPKDAFVKWVAINFLDVELIFPNMIEKLKSTKYQIAVTEHGKRELERVGYKPFYAPLGVDTKLFAPDEVRRATFRAKKKWADDTFVIGLVGINYGTDRKNIIGLLRAFQGFNKRHPNSKLYLHTDVMGSTAGGIPLEWVISSCGFDSQNNGPVQYVNQKEYHLWSIAQEEVADTYRGVDVFCLPSHGEGFGFPWLEAQSCGTPTITVDTTSGRQLNFGGYIIPVPEDYLHWSTHLSWFADVPPSAIDEQLELAYKDWENKVAWKKRQEDARNGAIEYEWDLVYSKYWRPILEQLGDRKILIQRLPNYGLDVYEKFSGRALMLDCWESCKNMNCKKLKEDTYPLLPGEWKGPISVLQRSYPIVPDKEGNLLIDTSCTLYKWLSTRFIAECKKYWLDLLSYPLIRDEVKKLWDKGYFDGKYVPLEDIKNPSFDEGYKTAWQSNIFTQFQFTPEMIEKIPKGGKVLDVGTGDGMRVNWLRSQGYQAVGTEINKSWINGDSIVYGDMIKLPFEDNSFDMVVSADVLEHLEDPLKGLSELFRVSRDWVVIQVTPTEFKEFFEDPTHKAVWDLARWQREIMEFTEQMIQFKNSIFMLKKKRIENENKVKVS